MNRLLLKIALIVWVLWLCAIGISRMAGQLLPSEPTAVFLFQNSGSLTLLSVDARTHVAYRHVYPDMFIRSDWPVMSNVCRVMVRQKRDDGMWQADLNLRTGQERLYLQGGELQPSGGFSPDRRYLWTQYSASLKNVQRILLNLETGEYTTKPLDVDRDRFSYPVWSPDSRYVIEIFTGNAPDNSRVTAPVGLLNLETGTSITLPDAYGNDYSWSPDSQQIALVDSDGMLVISDLNGQIQHRFTAYSQILAQHWQPDSTHMLIFARNAAAPDDVTTPYRLVEWSPDDNSIVERPITILPDAAPPGVLASPRWWTSPDWSSLFYDTDDTPPVILDMQTGATRMTLPDDLQVRWLFWSGVDNRYVVIIPIVGQGVIADTLSQTMLPLNLTLNAMSWQMISTGKELGYFDNARGTLGRIIFGDDGVHIETIEQPLADYATWCYPESDA